MVVASMLKPGTKYVANQSKATLITIENRPRVTMLIGRNRSFSAGLAIFWSKVSTTPARIKVIQSVYDTVGKAKARIKMVIMETIIGLSKFIY